jgi:thiol-disulfide isomerase/thioredoxin
MGVLALVALAARATGQQSQAQKPADIWKALLLGYRAAENHAGRLEVLRVYTKKLLDHAATHNKEASGVEALDYILQVPVEVPGNPQGKAAALLKKDFITNSQLGTSLRARAWNLYMGVQEKIVLENEDNRAVEAARKEMDAARQLAVADLKGAVKDLFIGGKMPNLNSTDLAGKGVKLSDFKGKVVMLDVWATWCPPCCRMIPHSREMVKKLRGKPFVLVGVSADDDRETLTKFMQTNEMPWTHWHNGPEGGLLSELNITAFPTIFLIDHNGVIRAKWVGSPGPAVIARTVEALVNKAPGRSE